MISQLKRPHRHLPIFRCDGKKALGKVIDGTQRGISKVQVYCSGSYATVMMRDHAVPLGPLLTQSLPISKLLFGKPEDLLRTFFKTVNYSLTFPKTTSTSMNIIPKASGLLNVLNFSLLLFCRYALVIRFLIFRLI